MEVRKAFFVDQITEAEARHTLFSLAQLKASHPAAFCLKLPSCANIYGTCVALLAMIDFWDAACTTEPQKALRSYSTLHHPFYTFSTFLKSSDTLLLLEPSRSITRYIYVCECAASMQILQA